MIRSPHTIIKITPEEMRSKKNPEIQHFRVPGCKVIVHVLKVKSDKFEPKSKSHILLGYSGTMRGIDSTMQKLKKNHHKLRRSIF